VEDILHHFEYLVRHGWVDKKEAARFVVDIDHSRHLFHVLSCDIQIPKVYSLLALR